MLNTKQKVIYELVKKRGEYISGEEIAAKYNLSRVAVAKAIKALRSEGYRFDAVRNKGYALMSTEDVLNEDVIKDYLCDNGILVEIFPEINSTNTYAKEHAHINSTDFITIANSQNSGRGRMSKTFYSPKGEGLYMTLSIRSPKILSAGIVTMYAAVAVSRIIDKFFGVKTDIKWVNDVYLEGKKICGILSEGILDIESGCFDWIIVGIGINLLEREFPAELSAIATSLAAYSNSSSKNTLSNGNNGNEAQNSTISRNELAARIYNEFSALIRSGESVDIINEYRAKSCVIGRKVTAICGEKNVSGTAQSILNNGNLVILSDEGETVSFSAGEISLKIS